MVIFNTLNSAPPSGSVFSRLFITLTVNFAVTVEISKYLDKKILHKHIAKTL